jgi:hypothetical protein
MRQILINILRVVKNQLLRFPSYIVLQWFSPLSIHIVYLSRLSRWIHQQPKIEFNDFYTPRIDYNRRYNLYGFVVKNESLDKKITYIEFGVGVGKSIEWWLNANQHPQSRFFGFDTFSGIPEDWGLLRKGSFSTNGKTPQFNDTRCRFIKGLFNDTLDDFLKNNPLQGRLVIHLDADLYSSTIFVLSKLNPYLKENDVMIFDEFNLPLDEFRAFDEFTEMAPCPFELLGAVNNYLQVAFKVKGSTKLNT